MRVIYYLAVNGGLVGGSENLYEVLQFAARLNCFYQLKARAFE